ncbi:hypothetical protein [Actinomadura kijaniata]|uniref:hypothetical protein n=1 Tax=Actinomadura kijaniata TaxID=46161 RepID=UPI003F52E6CC
MVLEEARSDTSRVVEQTWHLPPVFTAATPGGAVATAGGTRVDFVRVPLPGDGAETPPPQVVKGSRTPSQGWVVTADRTARPAPVVRLGGRGRAGADAHGDRPVAEP